MDVARERNTVKQFLTPHEVAERYHGNLSVRTLANWRSQGVGPAFTKIGGSIMYPFNLLLEWEEMNTVTSTRQYRSKGTR